VADENRAFGASHELICLSPQAGVQSLRLTVCVILEAFVKILRTNQASRWELPPAGLQVTVSGFPVEQGRCELSLLEVVAGLEGTRVSAGGTPQNYCGTVSLVSREIDAFRF
jgi:hypothetical protein